MNDASTTTQGRCFCLADPPYIGCPKRYPGKTEVDTPSYVRLCPQFPDRSALCCSSPKLTVVLRHCWEEEVRVLAWVKPFAVSRPTSGSRLPGSQLYSMGDVSPGGPRSRLASRGQSVKGGLFGAKPDEFCRWILDSLGYLDGERSWTYTPEPAQ